MTRRVDNSNLLAGKVPPWLRHCSDNSKLEVGKFLARGTHSEVEVVCGPHYGYH